MKGCAPVMANQSSAELWCVHKVLPLHKSLGIDRIVDVLMDMYRAGALAFSYVSF